MQTINITPANIEHESIVLLMAENFHREDGHPLKTTSFDTIRSALSGNPLGKIYLITVNEKVAGYFALCFTLSLEFGGLVVILDDLYLQPSERNKGIGSIVIAEVESIARNLKAVQIFLEVERVNNKSIKFYLKNGFKTRARDMMEKNF